MLYLEQIDRIKEHTVQLGWRKWRIIQKDMHVQVQT
jgi:hypothetical protein